MKMNKYIKVWIFLYLFFCIDGQSFYRNYYKGRVRDPVLGKEMLKNLARIIERVKNSPEFHPLKFGIFSLTAGHEIADSITKYLVRQNLSTYQVKIDNLSVTTSIMKYVDVTWIIVVDNFHGLYPYIHLEKDLWKPISKFIIVFVGEDTGNSSKIIFRSLWRKYNVCKVLITFAQENFRCLYKYSPFKLYKKEYGAVEKVYLDASEVSEEFLQGSQNYKMEDIKKYSRMFNLRNLPNKLADVNLLNLTFVDGELHQNNSTMKNDTEHFDDQFQNWSSHADNGNGKLWKNLSRIFEDFSDFNNYPLNVIVFNSLMMNVSMGNNRELIFSGIDGEALMSLKKYMNSHFRIKDITSNSSKNDPFFEALHSIKNGKADIVITGYFIKFYQDANNHEFTVSVFEDKLCLLAPSSGPIPKYAMPFIPFRRSLWYLLLAHHVLVAILWQLMKHYGGEVNTKDQCVSLRQKSHLQIPEVSRRQIILSKESKAFQNCPQERITKSYNGMRFLTRYMDNRRRQVWERDLLHDIQIGSHVFPQIEENELDRIARNYTFSKQQVTPSFPGNYRGYVTACKMPNKQYQTGPPNIHPCLKIFGEIYINVCYPLEGAKSPAQHLLLCNILIFSIVIVGLYQSCLVSTLSKPMMKEELHTLADVAETNLDIVTKYYNLLASTFTEDSPVSNKLRMRMKTVHSKEGTRDLIAFKKNAIALARFASLELEDFTSYYDQEGNKLLHVVEECPSTYMIAYVVKFSSPYLDRINALLLRMTEAGLFKEWYQNIIYQIKMDERKMRENRNIKNIKLTISHYFLTFLLLFIGLFGCTLVLLTELYVARNWKGSSAKILQDEN